MIFSVGIRPIAFKDVDNIRQQAPIEERVRIDLAFQFLTCVELREDAHLKGEGFAQDPAFRKLSRGPLEVFYRVRPLEDRYLEVTHVGRAKVNPET